MCDCGNTVNIEKSNGDLQSPILVNFYKNLKDRVLWIDFDITDALVEFERYIIDWNREDKGIEVEKRKPIKLLIYSYGGDVDAMLSFIDIMKLSKTPVWTINMGQCLSAGGMLLMTGQKRFAMPNSQVLIHEGSVGNIGGDTNKVVDIADNLKEMQKFIEDFIISHTSIDKKLYKKFAKKEWYITAKQSLEYGIVDEIITDIDMLY